MVTCWHSSSAPSRLLGVDGAGSLHPGTGPEKSGGPEESHLRATRLLIGAVAGTPVERRRGAMPQGGSSWLILEARSVPQALESLPRVTSMRGALGADRGQNQIDPMAATSAAKGHRAKATPRRSGLSEARSRARRCFGR